MHERHPRIADSVAFCGMSRFKQLLRPSVATFAHYVGRRFGSSRDPDGFWLSVSTGAGLDTGDPALALREYLRKRHGDATAANRIGGARFTSYLEAEVCIRAWNAHCEGASMKHVQLGDIIPQPFGAPKYGKGEEKNAVRQVKLRGQANRKGAA